MKRLLALVAASLALFAAAVAPVGAQPAAPAAPPAPAKAEPIRYALEGEGLTLNVVDVSPRFLAFWEAARGEADADRRFALWQRHYGFAAVPPGPRGQAIARQLLDAAWPKYEAALPMLRQGSRGLRVDAVDIAERVAAVLKPDGPVSIRMVTYVGGFEDNAFTYGDNGVSVINVPIEISPDAGAAIFAHEMTHAVHMVVGRLSGGWERSIGATILQEGLAVHVAREVVPGRALAHYIEHYPGWLAEVEAKRGAILAGLKPHLGAADGETVFRFTMGEGATGSEREAYYAGFAVVQHLRDRGMTLAQIARIPEADMPEVVERAITEMTAG